MGIRIECVDLRVPYFLTYNKRCIGGECPRCGRPDDDVERLVVGQGELLRLVHGHAEFHPDGDGGVVLVLDLGLGERAALALFYDRASALSLAPRGLDINAAIAPAAVGIRSLLITSPSSILGMQ